MINYTVKSADGENKSYKDYNTALADYNERYNNRDTNIYLVKNERTIFNKNDTILCHHKRIGF